ncbi:MAG TPA: hypothetical protein VHB47_26915 [Thermoanaerobaculia bacterium]|jgi:hypothetical protein|nr:hypothetical protein [Thermoanaerobaculia bacterium]
MERPSHREPAPAVGGAGAIPVSLRIGWWVLLGCAGVMVAAVLGLAEQLGARLLVAGLPGPLCFGGMLLLVAWWHTRGPGRHLWSMPASFGHRWWSASTSPLPNSRSADTMHDADGIAPRT